MVNKKIGLIKIDWFNLRVEFSPNIKLISKKGQSITGSDEIEETIINFEIESNNLDGTEYASYILSSNSVEPDEPFDLDNPWYKNFEGEEVAGGVASKPASTSAPKKKKKKSKKEAPKKESSNQKQIQKVQAQIDSLNNMIKKLDASFQNKKISQEEYIKKKNFLGEKLGTLMGKLSQLQD